MSVVLRTCLRSSTPQMQARSYTSAQGCASIGSNNGHAKDPTIPLISCVWSPVRDSGSFHSSLIGGIPGASPSRIGLVSFNKNAFESYGLSGNQNAPISRDAAEYCATALNRLLDDGYLDPRQSGQSLPPRNVRLSADTIVCFWSPKPSNFCSVFSGLLEANPDTVKELYRSIWRGTMPQIEDKAEFYALTSAEHRAGLSCGTGSSPR